MYPHQEATIQKTVDFFLQDPDAQALLLGGSIAHGFETPGSDVDIMILIGEELYQEKKAQGRLTIFNKELSTYPEGYVDGKYIALSYMEQVAEKGSEPARFAFDGARVLFSKAAGLEETLRRAARYPIEGKSDQMRRFAAQLEAWNWFVSEATGKNNQYLLWTAVSRLVLFGGRLILAHNELLYPYHKWFLRVLSGAKDQPAGLQERIADLYAAPTVANAQRFHDLVAGFQDWGLDPVTWGAQFMVDSELNWQTGFTPIDDL